MKRYVTLCVVSMLVLAALPARAALAATASTSCSVTADALRVRAAPNGEPIGMVYDGAHLQAVARSADSVWVQVGWSERPAWVMGRWLQCEGAIAELRTSGADDPPTATPATPATVLAKETDPLAAAMFAAVNEVRATYGLSAYDAEPRAAAAAQWQAEDMVRRGYFAHNTPDGDRPADLMQARGIGCATGWCGQNIIMGWTADEIGDSIRWFMNSPVHRANLLHRRYTGLGVGVAQVRPGLRYYVLNFYGP